MLDTLFFPILVTYEILINFDLVCKKVIKKYVKGHMDGIFNLSHPRPVSKLLRLGLKRVADRTKPKILSEFKPPLITFNKFLFWLWFLTSFLLKRIDILWSNILNFASKYFFKGM